MIAGAFAALAALASTAVHCGRPAEQKPTPLSPPVTMEQARRELLKHPLARAIGVNDSTPFALSTKQRTFLPEAFFPMCLQWEARDGDVWVSAYDASCLSLASTDMDTCHSREFSLQFYGKDAPREELLKSKKPDAELDRIASRYAKAHCAWFGRFNERFVTAAPFARTYQREICFFRKTGGVWCSMYCRVGVEVVTGRVVFYQQFFAPCDAVPVPTLTRARAARLGMISAGFRRGLYVPMGKEWRSHRPYHDGDPLITGVDALGCQRLAWFVHVEGEFGGDTGCVSLLVDDPSGEVLGVVGWLEEPSEESAWAPVPKDPAGKAERLPVLIDGRAIPVLFPPLLRGHTIYLFVDCLKPWGVTSRREDGALVLRGRGGEELCRLRNAWNRRGLLYVPLKSVLPFLKGSASVLRVKGKLTVSFILPRDHDE
jgi:hypothetical protein